MSLLAKQVVKNKCWIVEDDGKKIATILSGPTGVTLVQDGQRERFSSLKLLSERYNIIVDKTKPVKAIKETHDVYGYPCEHKANNILWDLQHKLPIFTKGNKSKSFFCAGYYIVQFNNGWVKSYCPKLITLNRYPYQGPYKTQEEMQEKLRTANGALNGITTESTSTSV
jgi:hypothetical protein